MFQDFFELAQKYNLAVLLRPGPYICAEFDFGALPWWLLNIDGVQLRTYEEKYVVYSFATPLPSLTWGLSMLLPNHTLTTPLRLPLLTSRPSPC